MGCCSFSSLRFLAEAGLFDDIESLTGLPELRIAKAPVSEPGDSSGVAIDTILHNGNFLLAVPAQDGESVTAVAIAGDEIVDVGDSARILGQGSETTRIVDLAGATVAPGFIEPHAHLISAIQGTYSTDLRYTRCRTYDDVMTVIKTEVDKAHSGDWVYFMNFDPSLLGFEANVGFPQLGFAQLNPISTDVNIFVENASGHIAYANHKAFKTAGVKHGDNPGGGGSYGTDGKHLNGVMFEPPSFTPFLKGINSAKIKPLVLPAMLALLKDMQLRGTTTFCDPAIGVAGPAQTLLEVYRRLSIDPNRSVDIVGSIDISSVYVTEGTTPLPPPLEGLTPPSAPGQNGSYQELVVPRVKIWADGSTQGYTAYVTKPYLPPVTPAGISDTGSADWTLDELKDLLGQAKAQNWGALVHVNGDAALDLALDALESVYGPDSGFKNRIEHCTVTRPEQYDAMQALGLNPTYLINHINIWGDTFNENILGNARASRLDAAAEALARGMAISFHCDYSVSFPDPLQYMQTAVTRQTSTGTVLGAELAISAIEALKAMTIYPAMQLGLDDTVGTIEVGRLANLVQLGQDPTTVAPTSIAAVPVQATWLHGRHIPVGTRAPTS
jgi:predicted amidohydrolase YtcJ